MLSKLHFERKLWCMNVFLKESDAILIFMHLFVVKEEKAIKRGILPILKRATLVQTFGQSYHVCMQEGSIVIPPYAPPSRIIAHLIPRNTPRSIFAYFRGLFYDLENDPDGGYYARYITCL